MEDQKAKQVWEASDSSRAGAYFAAEQANKTPRLRIDANRLTGFTFSESKQFCGHSCGRIDQYHNAHVLADWKCTASVSGVCDDRSSD
jgi:hypothetical protein